MNYKNWLLGNIPSEEIALLVSKRTGTLLIIDAFLFLVAPIRYVFSTFPPHYLDLFVLGEGIVFIVCAFYVRNKNNYYASILCGLIVLHGTINFASTIAVGQFNFIGILLTIFFILVAYSSLMATSFLRKIKNK